MLCFIDTETTGLDVRIHQPWELTYWREDHDEPVTIQLPHTLKHADPQALEINGYYERVNYLAASTYGEAARTRLAQHLTGVTLVGSKPEFDMAMLKNWVIGYEPWHHRPINVSDMAMLLFNWDKPRGLADVQATIQRLGISTAKPDHTSEQDVHAVHDVYWALRELRNQLPGFA